MRFLLRAPDMAEEMVEQGADKFAERYVRPRSSIYHSIHVRYSLCAYTVEQTQAMMISTQHLFPVIPPPITLDHAPPPVATAVQTPATTEGRSLAVTPQPAASGTSLTTLVCTGLSCCATIGSATTPVTPAAEEPSAAENGTKEVKDEDVEMADAVAEKAEGDELDGEIGKEPEASKKEETQEPKDLQKKDKGKALEKPVEIIDVDELDTNTLVAPTPAAPVPLPMPMPLAYSAFNIDVSFEASKLPLDVAIFNSARAAGGDEKIRKYLQAVLVIGGSALVPGMAHALESRYVRYCSHSPSSLQFPLYS